MAKANESLILIDDYVLKATLDILRGRKDGVSIIIYTTSNPRNKDRLSENEIKDFNNQYGKLEVKSDDTFHDRFLIIDNKELYSIGASLFIRVRYALPNDLSLPSIIIFAILKTTSCHSDSWSL